MPTFVFHDKAEAIMFKHDKGVYFPDDGSWHDNIEYIVKISLHWDQ